MENNIIDVITKHIMSSLKEGDKSRVSTLRLMKAKLIEYTTQKGSPILNEAASVEVFKKMKKERLQDIELFKSANRLELIDKTKEEIRVLDEYIPKEASSDDIVVFINTILPITQKEMGIAIKRVKEHFVSVDGALVAKLIKEKLS